MTKSFVDSNGMYIAETLDGRRLEVEKVANLINFTTNGIVNIPAKDIHLLVSFLQKLIPSKDKTINDTNNITISTDDVEYNVFNSIYSSCKHRVKSLKEFRKELISLEFQTRKAFNASNVERQTYPLKLIKRYAKLVWNNNNMKFDTINHYKNVDGVEGITLPEAKIDMLLVLICDNGDVTNCKAFSFNGELKWVDLINPDVNIFKSNEFLDHYVSYVLIPLK